MEQKKEYYAFISYKREDEQWAKWLQHKLEHYRLPANLNGRTDLPREIRPVFRDTSELNPGNLPQQIHDALSSSQHLIVVCSPNSAKSKWVNLEIETFIAMGKQDCIIPFIVDGHPYAENPTEECFPPAIRNLPKEQELLGANINEMGRDAAAIKTVRGCPPAIKAPSPARRAFQITQAPRRSAPFFMPPKTKPAAIRPTIITGIAQPIILAPVFFGGIELISSVSVFS